jgi:hypothetical protein
MSSDKEQLDVDDDIPVDSDDAEPVVEVAKTNLSKRQSAGGAPTAEAIVRVRLRSMTPEASSNGGFVLSIGS